MNYLLTNLESARLFFREADSVHFNEWLEFFKDARAHQHWTFEDRSAIQLCEHWYARQRERAEMQHGGMNALIEKETGRLVGHAGLLIQEVDGDEQLEVAYSLLPEFWNCGFAIEAARKCRDYAFEYNLRDSLISIISLTNLASQKVALKNGMTIARQTIYKENEVFIFKITKPF